MSGTILKAHCGYQTGTCSCNGSIGAHLYDKNETWVRGVCIDQNACSNQLVHCQPWDDYLQTKSNPVKHLAKQRAHLRYCIFTVELLEAERKHIEPIHNIWVCLDIVMP